MPGVNEDDRKAICGLNAKQQAGRRGDKTIPDELLGWWRVDEMNDVGVNLAEGHKRPNILARVNANVAKESRPVALDCRFGVVFGESEVEGFAAVGAGGTTWARRKSVDKPGNFAQVGGA
jgi:hypothetical protein